MRKGYAAAAAAAVLLGAGGAASAQTGQGELVSGSNPYIADAETVAKVQEADTHVQKGRELLKRGDADAAIAAFNAARKIWPEVGVETYMAEACVLKGQDAAAIEWYRKVIYPPPGKYIAQTDPVQLMRYAIVLNRTGQREEAATIYHRALQYLPRDREYLPKGVAPLDITFSTPGYDPRRFEAAARVALAITLLFFSDREALAQIDAALRLQPRLGIAHYYRGDLLSRVPGKAAEAVAEFSEALRHGRGLRPFVDNSLRHAPKELRDLAAKSLE